MPQTASQLNPFMLLMNPEVVLAVIEKSEKLSQLSSQLCRPLDRIPPNAIEASEDADSSDVSDPKKSAA